MGRVRVIHYLNQFFGGLGGEDQAGVAPSVIDGAKGPGLLLMQLDPDLEIVATIIAGDDHMMDGGDAAVGAVVDLVRGVIDAGDEPPALLVAGPAFFAGRYGLACGSVCAAVAERIGLPAVTALHPENPGADAFRRTVPIVEAGRDVLGMPAAMEGLARVGKKLAAGEPLVPSADGTLTRGIRQNEFAGETGAVRAVAMLMKKLAGEPFETEYEMPLFERVPPAPAAPDLSSCRVAFVTSGGIVPRGNPDRIESADASRFGAYDITGLERLSSQTHTTVHGGYDPTYAFEDPNRVLPLDVVRELVAEGRIGDLHETYYATVGNATSVERARKFGAEIAAQLKEAQVQAVILTST